MSRTPNSYLIVATLFALCEATAQLQLASPAGDALVTIDYIPSPNFGRVSAIIRDKQGFLWFGTTNGLYKYDGYDVRVYENVASRDTVISLRNRVTAILNNPDGSLLLATWSGVWNFDPFTERFEPLMKDTRLGNGKIEALARDGSGTLWIATRNDGAFSYNTASNDLRHFSVHNGLSDSAVYALLVDHRGAVWMGTRNGGLNRLDPATSTITHYRHKPTDPASLSLGFIATILQDINRSIWVGTYEGLDRLNLSSGRAHRTHIPGKPEAAVSALAQDPEGRIWVGFSEEGVFCLLNDSVLHFSNTGTQYPLLSDGAVDEIYVDPTSTRERTLVWVGTRGGGVNKIVMKRNPFKVALRDQGSFEIGRGAVLALFEDRKGVLWVGTWGGGLHAYKRMGNTYGRIAAYKYNPGQPSGLPSNNVHCILEDRAGSLWVGTDAGLIRIEAGRFVHYKHDPRDSTSVVWNSISILHEDSHGTLWIGTPRGISRLIRGSPNSFKSYLRTAGLVREQGSNDVTGIVEDRSSNLWVAMRGKGLNRFDRENDRFILISHPMDTVGMGENWMSMAFVDHEGILWTWTNNGLVTFYPGSEKFSKVDGSFLHRAYVFDMEEDNDGHMWFSTGIGLLRLTLSTGAVVRYDQRHGFPFSELTSEFFRTSRGSLYVGGLDGFAEFTPDSMIENPLVPPIAITEFAVFGKTQPQTAPEIQLAHNQNFFSFSFAALDYIDPTRNRFAYWMEGVDTTWIDAGTRHHASYTNLDPGNYIFRVKGSNSDGVWNQEGTSVRIDISPPFWQTWWFILTSGVLLIGIVAAADRYRVNRLLEMQRVRLRIARDLHDDIGSNLGAIAFVSRTLQNAPELSDATRRRLTTIYNTAVKTSEGMRDIVWFITPERDNIDDLVLHMKDTASSMLGPIEHRFDDRSGGADMHLSLEFRRKVFLAFKETLTNIVKHSTATFVEIEVTRRNGTLQVSVRDNGKGFDEREVRSGNGLASMRNRATTVGGECIISSTPGIGTTVKLTASLRENKR